MLFNSLEFVVFFIVFFAIYVMLKHRWQNYALLVASYAFYGAWDYRFLGLLFFTTIVDYFVGLSIGRQKTAHARKIVLTISLCVNLGVLSLFKYYDFFVASFVSLADGVGVTLSPLTLHIILPVGISFYTFQSMSYTIDVYRGRLKPCNKLLDFALFVAFFPQLMAGPIERAVTLIPQVLMPRIVTLEKIGCGLALIALGVFKKVVVADNLAVTVNQIFSKPGDFRTDEVIVGCLYFAFQIYGDFSGYSDIARGLSRLLGFELMVNFRQPYFSSTPSEFWTRWHISLSTWLRDYLYIPLGGNRGGELFTYRNLMLTMLLGGLWHGAAWTYVLWGAYQGLLLVAYRLYSASADTRRESVLGLDKTQVWRKLSAMALMFTFTLYGWLLFRAQNTHQIAEMTSALFAFTSSGILFPSVVKLSAFIWPVILIDYMQFHFKDDEPAFIRVPLFAQTCGYVFLILMFLIMGMYEGTSFIYFQF